MTTHAELVAAVEKARANVGWEPWDQDKHLPDHPPPWQPDEVAEWERVHGHDFRLKCYAEYGCQVIESAANNAHLDTLAAILRNGCCDRVDCTEECCLFLRGIVGDALTRMGAL